MGKRRNDFSESRFAPTASPAWLRYADWFLARALKLREIGDVENAETLERRGLEHLDQAEPNEQQQPKTK